LDAVRIGRKVWDVLAVGDSQGKCVLLEELAALDESFAASRDKILAFLRYSIPEHGPEKFPMACDKIDDDLSEFIRGRFRVLWFRDGGRVIVCTSMFMKKTRRTPESEKRRARNLRSEYLVAKSTGRLRVLDLKTRDQDEGKPDNAAI
jgi:phage-related protein